MQKSIDIRKELVVEISTSVSIFTRHMSLRFEELSKKERIERYYEWRAITPKIRGTILAYYKDPSTAKKWNNLYDVVTKYFMLFEDLLRDDKERKDAFDYIKSFLPETDSHKPDWNMIEQKILKERNIMDPELIPSWNALQYLVRNKGDELLKNIMNKEIQGYMNHN